MVDLSNDFILYYKKSRVEDAKLRTAQEINENQIQSYLYNGYSQSVMPRDVALPVPEDVASKVCNPPMVREPPGRPKLSRIKGALENAMERNRPRNESLCGNCHQHGHNQRTCKA
ncbi:unnamed protein product [Arabis nemorensis]|uniref:CCHC-type domain-containing protein n=1 Tax=Arabis nemorensis TaxID=586526 RepID=A0A565BN23_9BRAS|nr:unnamed protein product [Arabis nemorensis]